MRSERIFLIGLMGAGKSTVGRLLGHSLYWPYVDNDEGLEEMTSDDAVTLSLGEAGSLHNAEEAWVANLLQVDRNYVGGLPGSIGDRPEQLLNVQNRGSVVYLRAQPGILADRIAMDTSERPWLKDDPLAVLSDMFNRRDQIFRESAHLVIDTDRAAAPDLALEIAGWFTN